MPENVRVVQVRTGQFYLSHVKSYYFRLGQVSPGYVRLVLVM